ncbi:MAG: hypothetical protein V3W41_11275 [Planctomycetota bacterium]
MKSVGIAFWNVESPQMRNRCTLVVLLDIIDPPLQKMSGGLYEGDNH